jgi:hypothetical protein
MGVYKPNGGFVITTNSNNFVGKIDVDSRTIKRVADALGIPPKSQDIENAPDSAVTVEQLISEIRSIYIFRGK